MSSPALETRSTTVPAFDLPMDEGPAATPRHVTDADWVRFEGYAAEMLASLGMDLTTPGSVETPRRFVRALFDATDGYDGDPKLLTAFPTECHGGANCELSQVIEGPIPFFALCEHLFLTIAPQIAGRMPGKPRLALVEGLGYEVSATPWAELSSVMRAGSHLFLRHGLTRPPRDPGARA